MWHFEMLIFFFFEILANRLGISNVAHTTTDIAVRIFQHMEFPSEIPLNKCPLIFPYMEIGKLGLVALVYGKGQRKRCGTLAIVFNSLGRV